jgi:hypothetical protein
MSQFLFLGASSAVFCMVMYFRNSSIAVESLRAYNTYIQVAEKILNQSKKTGNAILDSFQKKTELYFFDESISRIPHKLASIEQARQFGKPQWIYSLESKKLQQIECIDNPEKHLPFLSVELTDSVKTYCLSPWVEDIHVSSNRVVPLYVLVLCWAFETNTDIHLFSNNWLLNVITEDGDEKTLNVLTELEVLEKPVDSI